VGERWCRWPSRRRRDTSRHRGPSTPQAQRRRRQPCLRPATSPQPQPHHRTPHDTTLPPGGTVHGMQNGGTLVSGIWSTNSWNKEANLLFIDLYFLCTPCRAQMLRSLMLFCVKFYFHATIPIHVTVLDNACYRVSLTKVYTHSFVILNYIVSWHYMLNCVQLIFWQRISNRTIFRRNVKRKICEPSRNY
jgi:hypothetical protein